MDYKLKTIKKIAKKYYDMAVKVGDEQLLHDMYDILSILNDIHTTKILNGIFDLKNKGHLSSMNK